MRPLYLEANFASIKQDGLILQMTTESFSSRKLQVRVKLGPWKHPASSLAMERLTLLVEEGINLWSQSHFQKSSPALSLILLPLRQC